MLFACMDASYFCINKKKVSPIWSQLY